MDLKPVVTWHDPEEIPPVKKYETCYFWIAVRSELSKGNHIDLVFPAQYVNKPLEFAEDDVDCETPLDPDPFYTSDGDFFEAIGWFDEKTSHEFDGFFEKIQFDDSYKLLGWGKYQAPEFNYDQED